MKSLFTRAMSALSRAARLSVCALAVVASSAGSVAAQGFINNLMNPGPPPADNYAVAMNQGRQIVGFGGKCIHVDGEMRRGALLVTHDCDANSVNQRFKFEGGNLKTSVRVANAPNGWTVMCVTAVGQERLAIDNCAGSGGGGLMGALQTQAPQAWQINGREIRRADGASCFDVYRDGTANGTPILYYRCHGGANQQWAGR
jgi:hypothetical protein